MTELSFLLELLLNQRMPLSTKELIVARIKEVERGMVQMSPMTLTNREPVTKPVTADPKTAQCASTAAILARNPDLVQGTLRSVSVVPPAAPEPVAVVAQTPAAAAAMASREAAIASALSGKIDKAAGKPRKF